MSHTSPELRKFLAILVILLFFMTPMGKHAFIGASNWVGKKVAGIITHSLPKTPTVVPGIAPTPSK